MTSGGYQTLKDWRVPGICLLLVASTLAVYSTTAVNGFVNYDDGVYVFDNPNVASGLNLKNLKWAVSAICAGNWHPLTMVSLMLDCQVFGVHPGAEHLVNAALHATSAGLLFLVLFGMTGHPLRSAVVAALFGLHPAHVESVAWIAERKDVLSGLFFMLTLWSYAHYARARAAGQVVGNEKAREIRPPKLGRRWVAWYLVAWVFLAFGLMSKPMLVTTPCLFLVLDYWPLNRINRAADLKALLLEKLPFFGLSLLASGVTLWAQRTSGAVVSLSSLPLQQRLANAACAYGFYIGKLVWPQGLMVPYVPEASPDPAGPWLGIGGLVFATIVFVSLGRRWRYLPVGWFWYLGTLVPVIGIVQVGDQSAADRYTYLPATGLFILFVWSAAGLGTFLRIPRSIKVAAATGIIGVCAFLASRQIGYWRNSETLFVHALTVDPTNLVALDCLAGSYAADPDPRVRDGAKALRLAQACVEQTQAREPVYLMTLASAYAELGQFGQAIDATQRALSLVESGPSTSLAKDLKTDLDQYKAGKTIYEGYRTKAPLGPATGNVSPARPQ